LVARSELRSAVEECLRDIRAQLLETAFTDLLNGGQLLDLEKALHHEVARCLDHLVARVIQAAHFGEELLDQVSELVALKPHLRMQDRGQHVNVTLLGGTQVEIVSPYMLQRPKKKRGRKRTKRGKSGNGFYPVLEILGIRERVTPALASSVARQLALGSVSQTEENLAELGIQLDRKRLHSIALSVGRRAILFRRNVIGWLPTLRRHLGKL
jgi:autonomous glycyl radical cofactor GrcA